MVRVIWLSIWLSITSLFLNSFWTSSANFHFKSKLVILVRRVFKKNEETASQDERLTSLFLKNVRTSCTNFHFKSKLVLWVQKLFKKNEETESQNDWQISCPTLSCHFFDDTNDPAYPEAQFPLATPPLAEHSLVV